MYVPLILLSADWQKTKTNSVIISQLYAFK